MGSHSKTNKRPPPLLVGLLSLYQILLCIMSVCSVLGTLLHAIPHPNHIVFYNFAALGVSYALYHWLEGEGSFSPPSSHHSSLSAPVPLWPILAGVGIYTALCPWLLYTFPQSFTLGEAMIVSQGITVMLVDTGIQLLSTVSIVWLEGYSSMGYSCLRWEVLGFKSRQTLGTYTV